MSLTLPAQTLRGVAIDLRRLNYTPTSWQGLLSTHSEAIRLQLEPLLVEMVREGAHPRLMALLLDRLADAQDALQRERNAWSFVWSGPDPLHAKTADTFATVNQLIREARSSLLIVTYNIGLSSEFRELYAYVDSRLISGYAERCYQHAKIVIADATTPEAKALVTSANFSETAQRHNFEAGWLTTSAMRSIEIQKQFSQSVDQGLFQLLTL